MGAEHCPLLQPSLTHAAAGRRQHTWSSVGGGTRLPSIPPHAQLFTHGDLRLARMLGIAAKGSEGPQVWISAWNCTPRGPLGAGPLPRGTPACMHAGARRAGTLWGGSCEDAGKATEIRFEQARGIVRSLEPSPSWGLRRPARRSGSLTVVCDGGFRRDRGKAAGCPVACHAETTAPSRILREAATHLHPSSNGATEAP